MQLVPAAAERSIISIAAEIDAACQTPRSCVGSDGLVIEGLDLDGGATFVLALW